MANEDDIPLMLIRQGATKDQLIAEYNDRADAYILRSESIPDRDPQDLAEALEQLSLMREGAVLVHLSHAITQTTCNELSRMVQQLQSAVIAMGSEIISDSDQGEDWKRGIVNPDDDE